MRLFPVSNGRSVDGTRQDRANLWPPFLACAAISSSSSSSSSSIYYDDDDDELDLRLKKNIVVVGIMKTFSF